MEYGRRGKISGIRDTWVGIGWRDCEAFVPAGHPSLLDFNVLCFRRSVSAAVCFNVVRPVMLVGDVGNGCLLVPLYIPNSPPYCYCMVPIVPQFKASLVFGLIEGADVQSAVYCAETWFSGAFPVPVSILLDQLAAWRYIRAFEAISATRLLEETM